MAIFRVRKKENYVVLDKGFLNDTRLSWKAKGLLAYMLSLPDDWSFCISNLATHSKCSRESTANIIKELSTAGYVHKVQGRTNMGKFRKVELSVFETPQVEPYSENPITVNPLMEKPLTEDPFTEKPSILINNKSLNNNLLNNYYNKSHSSEENIPKPQSAFQFYEQNGFGSLVAHVTYKIGHWINELSEDLVIHAMKQAIENNVLRWNYVEKILHVWTTKKFTTIEEVEADKLRFVARKQQQRTYQSNLQVHKEVVPDWFHQRNGNSNEIEDGQAIDFEAERQKVLETLRNLTESAR
ncbi:DnaD domain protein [Lysinibacillus sp. NPDC056185]|uniref:DnaD domain protein n=1 Tax=Lysinibacillus sp. NPDC056185 TaxID=3345739 RepID=UPI0039F0C9FA